MPESMIERVSRAICVAAGLDPDRHFASSNYDDGTAPHKLAWHEFQPEARAAIEAMRQPTDAMEKAAFANMDRNGYTIGNPASDYTAMIDTALKD